MNRYSRLSVLMTGGVVAGVAALAAPTFAGEVSPELVSACRADTTGDGQVDANDVIGVLLDFGTTGEANRGDADSSGIVDMDDIVAVVLNFGPVVENGNDCNGNGQADGCDVALQEVQNCNGDDEPDECSMVAFPVVVTENTTGIADGTFTGPPDSIVAGIGAGFVTFDFGTTWIANGPGGDLNVYESKFGGARFGSIRVFVSLDNVTFFEVTDSINPAVPVPGDEIHDNPSNRKSYDLAGSGGPPFARFVRVESIEEPDGNGLDLDAIAAVNTTFGDCNFNFTWDACDVASGAALDCDGNGIPDACDPDCNGNGTPDSCDIADGGTEDANGNGIPDECEALTCEGDTDENDIVDLNDMVNVILDMGSDGSVNNTDIDQSGVVDMDDMLRVSENMGPCS